MKKETPRPSLPPAARTSSTPSQKPPGDDFDDDELSERVLEEGREVAYQDWDSGGPGAGAGRVSVYFIIMGV